MGTRITSRLQPTRTKLRQAETRLGNVQTITRKYHRIAVETAQPELNACVDELWLALFGHSRR